MTLATDHGYKSERPLIGLSVGLCMEDYISTPPRPAPLARRTHLYTDSTDEAAPVLSAAETRARIAHAIATPLLPSFSRKASPVVTVKTTSALSSAIQKSIRVEAPVKPGSRASSPKVIVEDFFELKKSEVEEKSAASSVNASPGGSVTQMTSFIDVIHELGYEDLEGFAKDLKKLSESRLKKNWMSRWSEKLESQLSGIEIVDWLMNQSGQRHVIDSKVCATFVGKALFEFGFLVPTKSQKKSLSFSADERLYRIKDSQFVRPLNTSVPSDPRGEKFDPLEIVEAALRKIATIFLAFHQLERENESKHIKLASVKNLFPERYYDFCFCVSQFVYSSLSEFIRSHEEKVSFFVNLYNLLYLHSLIESDLWNYEAKNQISRELLVSRSSAYCVDGHSFSLLDIKYAILRSNAPLPSFPEIDQQLLFVPKLSGDEFKKSFKLDHAESRLMFTLCNATKSGPKLRVYRPETLRHDLDAAVRDYLDKTLELKSHGDLRHPMLHMTVPEVFDWYRGDFGKTKENVQLWIADHHYDWLIKSRIADFTYAQSVKLIYREYDWAFDPLSAEAVVRWD